MRVHIVYVGRWLLAEINDEFGRLGSQGLERLVLARGLTRTGFPGVEYHYDGGGRKGVAHLLEDRRAVR